MFAIIFPENPRAERIDHAAARQILQTFIDDLNRAEATLAEVTDDRTKQPLSIGRIKIDIFGTGQSVNPAFIFRRFGDADIPEE
jgi:hypothetical protein